MLELSKAEATLLKWTRVVFAVGSFVLLVANIILWNKLGWSGRGFLGAIFLVCYGALGYLLITFGPWVDENQPQQSRSLEDRLTRTIYGITLVVIVAGSMPFAYVAVTGSTTYLGEFHPYLSRAVAGTVAILLWVLVGYLVFRLPKHFKLTSME